MKKILLIIFSFFLSFFIFFLFSSRIAEIALVYRNELIIPRTSCGILAILSYNVRSHAYLSHADVLNTLFSLVDNPGENEEDQTTKELVGVCFCNLSSSEIPRTVAINAKLIAQLSQLSSVTNEFIQSLCARCICNLTCSGCLFHLFIYLFIY